MFQRESFIKNIKTSHDNWWYVRDGKLQYGINREAAKISSLSSRKINKYEYLTCEKRLLSNRIQIIEQAKFTYSPLEKALEKIYRKTSWCYKVFRFF